MRGTCERKTENTSTENTMLCLLHAHSFPPFSDLCQRAKGAWRWGSKRTTEKVIKPAKLIIIITRRVGRAALRVYPQMIYPHAFRGDFVVGRSHGWGHARVITIIARADDAEDEDSHVTLRLRSAGAGLARCFAVSYFVRREIWFAFHGREYLAPKELLLLLLLKGVSL